MKYHVYMLITAFSYSFLITAANFTQLKNSLSSLQSSLNILATSLQEITKKAGTSPEPGPIEPEKSITEEQKRNIEELAKETARKLDTGTISDNIQKVIPKWTGEPIQSFSSFTKIANKIYDELFRDSIESFMKDTPKTAPFIHYLIYKITHEIETTLSIISIPYELRNITKIIPLTCVKYIGAQVPKYKVLPKDAIDVITKLTSGNETARKTLIEAALYGNCTDIVNVLCKKEFLQIISQILKKEEIRIDNYKKDKIYIDSWYSQLYNLIPYDLQPYNTPLVKIYEELLETCAFKKNLHSLLENNIWREEIIKKIKNYYDYNFFIFFYLVDSSKLEGNAKQFINSLKYQLETYYAFFNLLDNFLTKHHLEITKLGDKIKDERGIFDIKKLEKLVAEMLNSVTIQYTSIENEPSSTTLGQFFSSITDEEIKKQCLETLLMYLKIELQSS